MRHSLAVVAVAALAASASAGTVDLSTGVADWEVAYAPIPGDYPTTQPTFGASASAVVIDSGNIPGSWASSPSADWIGTGTSPRDNAGFYKYTLVINDMGSGPWNFSGTYTADNQVISMTVAGTNLFSFNADLASNPQDFKDFDDTFMLGGGDIEIEIIVFNERVTNPVNPTGLLLHGTAEMIPLPGAAGMAFAGVGLLAARRRRV